MLNEGGKQWWPEYALMVPSDWVFSSFVFVYYTDWMGALLVCATLMPARQPPMALKTGSRVVWTKATQICTERKQARELDHNYTDSNDLSLKFRFKFRCANITRRMKKRTTSRMRRAGVVNQMEKKVISEKARPQTMARGMAKMAASRR